MDLNDANPLTREIVIDFIINSQLYGNLGLFIGSGFSKALLNTNHNIALNWRELIDAIAQRLNFDIATLIEDGKDYPSLISDLCYQISQRDQIEFSVVENMVKEEIAELTNWTVDYSEKEKYKNFLEKIDPNWIITTNYDLLIEQIISEKALPLEPNDALCLQDNLIPIYHLHGIRTNPRSIVISRNDYIGILRPNQYNQIRLSFALKESTTLFLGYNLGDINVLTAIDWSKNVFNQGRNQFPNESIQFVRGDSSELPYRDHNGIIIIKHSSIEEFFEEIIIRIDNLIKIKKENEKEYDKLLLDYKKELNDNLAQLILDRSLRLSYFSSFSKYSPNFDNLSLMYIAPLLEKCWNEARKDGNFVYYDYYLKIIIDTIHSIPIKQHHSSILRLLANSLEKLIPFLGMGYGKAHDATKTWDKEFPSLPSQIIKQIKTIASQFEMKNLNFKLEI